jgi:hypothetical protein
MSRLKRDSLFVKLTERIDEVLSTAAALDLPLTRSNESAELTAEKLKKNVGPDIPNTSVDELIQILKMRASSVSEVLEKEREEMLDRIKNSKTKAGSKTQKTTDELQRHLGKLDLMREAFLSLHPEHINALKEGKFVLAHEILKKIHELLFNRDPLQVKLTNEIERTGGYSGVMVFSFPNSYPGPIPKNLSADTARFAQMFWPEFAKQDDIRMLGANPWGW